MLEMFEPKLSKLISKLKLKLKKIILNELVIFKLEEKKYFCYSRT